MLGHEVTINAATFTPVDADLIPTGELRSLAGSPLDFRTPTPIGARIEADDEQLRIGSGYDHNYVIDKPAGELGLMARVSEPTTGRTLEVYSDAPGMQFYSANFLGPIRSAKGGSPTSAATPSAWSRRASRTRPTSPSSHGGTAPRRGLRHTIVYKFGVL